jgi:hypothetical protein
VSILASLARTAMTDSASYQLSPQKPVLCVDSRLLRSQNTGADRRVLPSAPSSDK